MADCTINDIDMTSYADNLTLLTSAPYVVEAEAKVSQLTTTVLSWADWKQLSSAPQKSSMNLFTSDNHYTIYILNSSKWNLI